MGSLMLRVCQAVGAGVLLRLGWLLATRRELQVHPSTELLFGVVALLGSILVALYQQRYWARPLREIRACLRRIRDGEAAIEELAEIRGGLRPLVADIQDLLRDSRRKRAELAQLDLEMSHRVARRTDALERVVGSLRQQATRDPLTGLNNRRMLDGYLPEVMERAQREDSPLCLMMIDVDDFKLLNDTLGHAAGDELLRTLGQLIRSNLRDGDMAFRCGGDEFVIVLRNTSPKQADTLSRRLVSLVDALGKTLRVSRPPRLSIGTATPLDVGPVPTAAALLAEADKHLYEVKVARKSGRRVA